MKSSFKIKVYENKCEEYETLRAIYLSKLQAEDLIEEYEVKNPQSSTKIKNYTLGTMKSQLSILENEIFRLERELGISKSRVIKVVNLTPKPKK